jgi:ketosteroid isomerase-like protein
MELLRRRGFRDDRTPLLHAVALAEEPPGTPGVEVRRVETFEDFVVARELQWDAFEAPPERRERQRPHLRTEFDETQASGHLVVFLALVEGRPAATASAVLAERGVFMIAGSTLPWARRRGCYRALVRARWDFAVERGVPALVTHAVPGTSYPILKRLGFEDVCTLRRLREQR